MKIFIIATLATFATAAKLDKVYLPPHARTSSGANAGLQAPGPALRSPGAGFHAAPQSSELKNQVEILRMDNEITEDGFRYAYETSDGTKAEQQGRVIPGAKPEEGSLQITGSYTYVGDDGRTYSVTYTADENGYHAEGDHLPTPPPIPEAILKSLELTAKGNAQYNNQRTSYDSDRMGY